MSNYDVAIGLNNEPLDQAARALFDNPDANKKIFRDTIKQKLDGVGEITLQYQAMAAPSFTLAPPTDDQWSRSIKAAGVTDKPSGNAFTLYFPILTASAQIDSGDPLTGTGELNIFSVIVQSGNKLSLVPKAVLINESSFSEWDAFIVNLDMATKILSGYDIPQIPAISGTSFNTPAVAIDNNLLLLATTQTINTGAIDISGVTWPGKPYFVLFSQSLMNTLMNNFSQQFKGLQKNGSEEKGNIAAKAHIEWKAVLKNVSASVKPDNPAQAILSVDAELSAVGGVNGIVPTLLCPVGTALNAL